MASVRQLVTYVADHGLMFDGFPGFDNPAYCDWLIEVGRQIDREKRGAPKQERPRNPDWDALVAVFKYEPPPSQRSLFGRWATDLRAMRGDSDPEPWLREAADLYRVAYPDAARTAHAVMKHAPALMAGRKTTETSTKEMDEIMRQAAEMGL